MLDIKLDLDNNRSVAIDDGKVVAYFSFCNSEKIIIIDHTEVEYKYSGMGIGKTC